MVVQEIREHDFDQELDLTVKNLVCGGNDWCMRMFRLYFPRERYI
ncbi:Uncharacterised protein [Streptococcus equi subsp. zooepidemicus]|nr:hypothetical protein [Streptococcus equi]QUQ80457.1 hypothetical protein LJFMMFNO_01470 [Streptococcus equi subsp. zooepidemicus]VTS32287.1 Uncharacterised protein [Streptococcus equi subsp. zooepidemicus]